VIINIGTDLHDIRDFERDFKKYRGAFTADEIELCDSREERMAAYAKRFVSKEAMIKALGANDVKGGVRLREIEVVLTKSGRPTLRLWGGALRQFKAITPVGMVCFAHLTISDCFPMAHADVIIEARDATTR